MILLFLALFFSCESHPSEKSSEQHEKPNTIYYNGYIYTSDQSTSIQEAMVIEENTIIFVGTTQEALKYQTKRSSLIDLKQKMVMPGIHDIHMHPLEVSSPSAGDIILSSEETNPENYIPELKYAKQKHQGNNWLIGWGHSIYTLLEGTRSPIEILDEVFPNRPVIIMEHTSHSMWVNTKALQEAGISKDTPNPIGGIYMKDTSGNLNGILIDNAGNMVMDIAVKEKRTDSHQKTYLGLLNYGLPKLNQHGITSICDARTYWKRGDEKIWQQLETNKMLSVRVNLGLWVYPTEDDHEQIETLKQMYSSDPNSFLKINQIKLYSDGITHNTTAALKKPYANLLDNSFHPKGLNYFSEQRLKTYITELEKVGYDFHIHAIGDRGIHESLNAIEYARSQNGSMGNRHRLTHLEIIDSSDLPRFNQLNVIADCQVAGEFTQPHSWSENTHTIGDRANNMVPLKSLYEANATLTLSSDWNVSTVNPFVGITHALTRSPQNLPIDAVLQAYTVNAAYAMKHDDITGSLEKGKRADFIILNQNIHTLASSTPEKIKETKVLYTFLNGKQVYPQN